jgi:hypothetical protein
MDDTLIIGGTRFIGRHTVAELLDHDYEVTLFNRGRHENPFGDRVARVTGDRTDGAALEAAAAEVDPDLVIDCVAYDPRDVETDLGVLADPTHHRSPAVRRQRWRDDIVCSIELYPFVPVDSFLDLLSVESSTGERCSSRSREGRSVKRQKDRPLITDGTECLLQSFERIAHLWRNGCLLVGLIFTEHDERPGFEVDITPANSASALVVRIAEDLSTANT